MNATNVEVRFRRNSTYKYFYQIKKKKKKLQSFWSDITGHSRFVLKHFNLLKLQLWRYKNNDTLHLKDEVHNTLLSASSCRLLSKKSK